MDTSIDLVWLLAGAIALLGARPLLQLWRDSSRDRALRVHGVRAEAIVLSVRDTRVTVNLDPRIELELEVSAPGRPPYRTRKMVLVSRLRVAELQPGVRLAVRFDPRRPEHVALEGAV